MSQVWGIIRHITLYANATVTIGNVGTSFFASTIRCIQNYPFNQRHDSFSATSHQISLQLKPCAVKFYWTFFPSEIPKMSEKMKSKIACSDDEHSEAEVNTLDKCILPLEKLNLGPRKKLLVLSLGGLLSHRVYRYERGRANIPSFRYVDASYGSFHVYKRPHCEDFMKFCLERFDVGIWSSAKEWYLDNALDCVMKGLRWKLVFAWDQVKCTASGFNTLEKRDKPLFLKELKKVWEDKCSKTRPSSSTGKYSSSNTLLIDNQPYKALLNPPHTAIFPAEYKVDQLDDMALGPKGELRLYLDGLADADDVTSYVKEHPFGQPAVTTAHSDWGYYSKIISRFQKD